MNRLEFFITLMELEIFNPLLAEMNENYLIINSKISFVDKNGLRQNLEGLLIQIDSNNVLSYHETLINKMLLDCNLPYAKLYHLQYPWIWNSTLEQWYIPDDKDNITYTPIKIGYKNE